MFYPSVPPVPINVPLLTGACSIYNRFVFIVSIVLSLYRLCTLSCTFFMHVWCVNSIKYEYEYETGILRSRRQSRRVKIRKKITLLKQGQKLPPTGGNMQGFLQTPWNATSRTTAQDASWQHILYRNTSSQPFMTPCARLTCVTDIGR